MDRMIYFLDTNFGIFLRTPYEHYSKMIKEFAKGGPLMWRRFAYQIFNINGNDRLCDHDMFNLLEQFKLREYITFFKELYGKEKIDHNYQEVIDETD